MSISLKDFTAKHLSANTEEGQTAIWRRVFPAQLRHHNKFQDRGWFRYPFIEVLEEKWERIHKGDVIDTEWRTLEYKDDDWDY